MRYPLHPCVFAWVVFIPRTYRCLKTSPIPSSLSAPCITLPLRLNKNTISLGSLYGDVVYISVSSVHQTWIPREQELYHFYLLFFFFKIQFSNGYILIAQWSFVKWIDELLLLLWIFIWSSEVKLFSPYVAKTFLYISSFIYLNLVFYGVGWYVVLIFTLLGAWGTSRICGLMSSSALENSCSLFLQILLQPLSFPHPFWDFNSICWELNK